MNMSKLNTVHKLQSCWSPFGSIITSVAFWALSGIRFGNSFCSQLLRTFYASSCLTSSLFILSGMIFGLIGYLLLKKQIMTTNAVRKWFSIFSTFIPGCYIVSTLLLGYTIPFILTVVAICLNASAVITSLHNGHDLSPNFAPTIYGLMGLVKLLANYLVQWLSTGIMDETISSDRFLFVCAGLFIGSNVIFVLFGSGHVQKWNRVSNEDEDNSDDNLNHVELNIGDRSEESL